MPNSRKLARRGFSPRCAILTHWAMTPATLYIWGLGPGSRKSKLSPTPRRNSTFIAPPSSTHRVQQLWSNRTWSTWLLFWSRKWPSEASNHPFSPLRGLGEGCALWVARKSSLTWGRRAKNTDFLAKNDSNWEFHFLARPATPMLDGLRTPDP